MKSQKRTCGPVQVQRLVPRSEDSHRIAVFEVLKSGTKLLDRLLAGASSSGGSPKSTGLDAEIEKLQKLIKELQEGEHAQRKDYENFLANLSVE